MKYIKLSEYAKNLSITYRTAWTHFKTGKIKNAIKTETGTIIIPEIEEKFTKNKVVIYARVSSTENKANLKKQSERLISYAEKNGFIIEKVIEEVGSGVNDNRKQLNELLKNNHKWDFILVEHKDRLTRFGFNYLNLLLNSLGKEILVVNLDKEIEHDLMEDLVSIIYSFSDRLYGLRRGKNKAKKIIEELKQ